MVCVANVMVVGPGTSKLLFGVLGVFVLVGFFFPERDDK